MTQDALLDALRQAMERAPKDDPGALTAHELMDALGLSIERTRRLLKDLLRSGQCEAVKVSRVDISGRVQSVPAYRLRKQRAVRAA